MSTNGAKFVSYIKLRPKKVGEKKLMKRSMLNTNDDNNTKYLRALNGLRFLLIMLVSITKDVTNMKIYANKSIERPNVVPVSVVRKVRLRNAPMSELKI